MTQSHFHGNNKYYIRSRKNTFAPMAELVDALVSNTSNFTVMPVRPRLGVHSLNKLFGRFHFKHR